MLKVDTVSEMSTEVDVQDNIYPAFVDTVSEMSTGVDSCLYASMLKL